MSSLEWIGLHGFTGTGSDFAPLSSLFPRLSCPDLPGHGPQAPPPDSPEPFADFARQLLADRSEPVGLLGYSLGGRLALQAALNCPDSVRALILVGAHPGLETPAEREERRRSDDQLADRIEREGLAAFLEAWQKQPLIRTQDAIPEPHRSRMREARKQNRAGGLAASLRVHGLGRMPPGWGRLPGLRCPVLLVTGENDLKFTALATRMRGLLPRAEHLILPAAGHCAHLENIPAFEDACRQFLDSLETAPS